MEALAIAPSGMTDRRRRSSRRSRLHGSEFVWAIAFVVPYAVIFLAFAAYPIAYGLWMASDPALYSDLLTYPLYAKTAVNTALYVGISVNLKMFLALLISGFFMRPRWWIKALLVVYILPWALAAIPAFIAIHWMLISNGGLINAALEAFFGIIGPRWLGTRWLALGANIAAYVWKWMPFWTVIFIAARMAIPQELYEAAEIDGAGGVRRFAHVTFPLLANIYLISTLLSTLWTVADFTTVNFVSSTAPSMSTGVLATLAIHYAFDFGKPELGLAAVASALPVLIPVAIVLLRKVHTTEVQL
jgi:multiple sugar transport system permease protein